MYPLSTNKLTRIVPKSIAFFLSSSYISNVYQIDYKEDIEDYIDNIKNFWGEQEIKLVRFELENDQNYYAKVPRISNVKNMYEVHILDER